MVNEFREKLASAYDSFWQRDMNEARLLKDDILSAVITARLGDYQALIMTTNARQDVISLAYKLIDWENVPIPVAVYCDRYKNIAEHRAATDGRRVLFCNSVI